MLAAVEGVYENGVVRLLEPLPGGVQQARVVVTFLPDTLAPLPRNAAPQKSTSQEQKVSIPPRPMIGDAVVDHYQPRTELGRQLIELRRTYIEEGGKLLSWEEIDAEVHERRGGAADD